jgi:hypothetical protein
MITRVAESKRQKQTYRRVLSQYGGDHLSDLVAAAHAGSEACLVCSLVRPVSSLSEGVCSVCRQTLSGSFVQRLLEKNVERLVAEPQDPLAVYVDASWQSGVAGIAVVGALGRHSDRVPAQSSSDAEVRAMLWALRIAKQRRDERVLVFRTDNHSAQRAGAHAVPNWARWSVEWVPRRRNYAADRLALQARVAA